MMNNHHHHHHRHLQRHINALSWLITVATMSICLLSNLANSSQIKILPYGKVRPIYRIQCLSEIPSDITLEQLTNMTVVWRDAEGNAIGESPVSVSPEDHYIGAEMSVQHAGASAQFSCAFKRPGGSALTGLQFSEIYVYARSEQCESDLAFCDPGKRICRQAKCVCQQGEHLFRGSQCTAGYSEPLPCQVISSSDAHQCSGRFQTIARRSPYVQCRQRKNRTLFDRVKLLVPTLRPRSDDFSHCPCSGTSAGNVIEINGIEYCQDVQEVTCCLPLSLLNDSHDFSLVWFTLISISIFIGLVLVAAFVLMVCKSRQQLQAQHRAQLRAIALQQQQQQQHHADDHFHAIFDPRVHRTISIASDKPPAYHEVVRRETNTPPPAYNLAIANLAGISPIVSSTSAEQVAIVAVSSRPSTPCPEDLQDQSSSSNSIERCRMATNEGKSNQQ